MSVTSCEGCLWEEGLEGFPCEICKDHDHFSSPKVGGFWREENADLRAKLEAAEASGKRCKERAEFGQQYVDAGVKLREMLDSAEASRDEWKERCDKAEGACKLGHMTIGCDCGRDGLCAYCGFTDDDCESPEILATYNAMSKSSGETK